MELHDIKRPRDILCERLECPYLAALDLALENERELIMHQQRLYEANPIPGSIWNKNHVMLDCNEAMLKMFGLTSKKELIENFFDYSPKTQPCGTESTEKAKELLLRAEKEGSVTGLWMHTHKNGEPIPCSGTLVHLKFKGEPMIVVYLQDLRLLRATDAKINEVINLNQMLLNTSPAMIEIWDSEINFVDCNMRALETYGLSTKENFGEIYKTVLCPEFQPCGTRSWELEVQNVVTTLSEGSLRYEWMLQTMSGEELPLEVNAFRLDFDDKKWVVYYSNDLREIKAAAQLASEREMTERTRLMFDATPLVIEYWNKNHEPIDCNQTALDYYGFPDREAYRNNLFRNTPAFQPDGTPSRFLWNKHLSKIFSDGRGKFEFANVLGGETRYSEVQGIRIKYNEEIVVVTYKNDVTKIREMEEERRKKEIAEESNRAKSLFLARMSHEIRTPISAVLGISEIQLQDPTLSPKNEDAFEKIFSSAEMLLSLVNDILDLSKIEAGKLTILSEDYNTADILGNLAHLTFARNANIKFEIEIDETLPRTLRGDHMRLEQILNNLLSNAFKYTERGSVKLSIRGEPTTDGILLVITIADTGYGMSPEQLATIHSDYARFHERENRFIGGAGLGIPIVFNLTKLMDGDISFESTPKKGTRVTVKIPQKVSVLSPIGEEIAASLTQFSHAKKPAKKTRKLTPEPMPYGKVLVVDDVEANLFVATGLLNFYELQIETCENGYDAINKIRDGKAYDIIFMDHMMPGINGITTMQKMREMGYTQPIFALTANAMLGKAEEFVKAGFDGFISKPIKTKELNSILVKNIKEKHPPDVVAAALEKSASAVDIDGYMLRDDVAAKLRADFVREQKNAVEKIKKAIDAKDFETARRLAHNLKGVSALIGEPELSAASEKLENILAKGKIPSAENFKEVKTLLAAVVEKIDVPAPLPAAKISTSEEIADIFEKLEPLLATRSSSAQDFLPQLRGLAETAALVRLIEDFEFAAAAKVLAALKGILT